MNFLLKLLEYPPIGKRALEIMKKRAFKPFQISVENAVEKQEKALKEKFRKMRGTGIGKKLGVREGVKLQELPITDYNFYKPFYDNPSRGDFMYPLENYVKMRTSGTAGTEKWFMIPQMAIIKAVRETAIPAGFSVFHDGEKITWEFGDTLYMNLGPAPFSTGVIASLASKKRAIPFLKIVPNLNLSYKEKVRFFIENYNSIDAAIMLASTLVYQIMPEIGKPIKLKGLLVLDSNVGKTYRAEIEKFAGTAPKNFYNATETIACSIPSVQHPLAFLFDTRRGVFEFLPIKNGKVEEETVGLEQVEVGGIYKLVFTPFLNELTRYDLKDAFRCVAKGDDIIGTDFSVFEFHSRFEKTISLQNFTRISEEELAEAFRRVKVPVVDFTARVVTEKGLEHLAIYVEIRGDMRAEEIKKKIKKELYEMDKDFRDLVDFFDYNPIRVFLVPRGVFAKCLEGKIAAIPKIEKINMREEEFKKFLQLIGATED